MPLLVVAFGVLSGAAILAQALEDAPAGRILGWIAAAVLMLTVVDLILLVGTLRIRALGEEDRPHDSDG